MYDARLREYLNLVESDQREFLCRLKLHDKDGVEVRFNDPYDEQVEALRDLMSPARSVVHLKPRQIGRSTLECAHNFCYTYWARDAVKTLVVAHEAEATDAIFQKIRHFHDSLPTSFQREVERSNKKELIFADTKAGFRCLTAGGKGQGRAWTYQRLHADELAYWPNAEAVWASVTSTLNKTGKHYRTSILSTPNGPGGLFHDKVRIARKAMLASDPTVRFRFFKWCDHQAYRMTPPQGWEPTQEEWELSKVHHLDMEQLYWRHHTIHGVDGIGRMRFRREFPVTPEEGFMVFEGCWFDALYLNDVLSSLGPSEGELRIFERPERGMTYAMGVDPAWCNGTGDEDDEGDWAVAQVLSADGRQVATFSANKGGEIRFFQKAIELAVMYNKAKVLCESNTGGAGSVGNRLFQQAGLTLWRQPPKPGMRSSKNPKFWTTGRGNKEEAYSHARQMVDNDVLTLNDEATVKECMHIREKDGRIEGHDGEHDDHAMALVLAEWNRKSLPTAKLTPSPFKRRYSARKSPFAYNTRPTR